MASSPRPRLAWATDIHLDHADVEARQRFARALAASGAEAVALTGDLAEAPTLTHFLDGLAEEVSLPIYFVLGNNDYYRGSIEGVRSVMRERYGSGRVRWLHGGWERFGDRALVGVDGWGDAQLGNVDETPIMISDFRLIEDLAWRDREARRDHLRSLGEVEAAALRGPLSEALAASDEVVVLTHIPPFAEACWYEGGTSHPDWQPWFTCHAVGKVLREAARAHPHKRLEVLCGHTHGAGVAEVLTNLIVYTGGADYGTPELQPGLR
ncbi:MAG: metallophosphoesterase family protein [Myxococcota bacterium]